MHLQMHLWVSVLAVPIGCGDERPTIRDWDGTLLLDPEREAHSLYGATAEALYFIRPDGYIGFRSQPADLAPLLEYLRTIFLGMEQQRPATAGPRLTELLASKARA